mgnify:CR=1 FL=1
MTDILDHLQPSSPLYEATRDAAGEEITSLRSLNKELAEALRRLLKWVEPIAGDNRDEAAEKEELASVEAARVSLKKAGVEW